MPAQIGRFSGMTSVRGLPDRRSWTVCGGPFSVITQKNRASARSHRNPVPSWHITNTGELDGAKEADGG